MPRHLVLRGDRTWLLASVGERAVEVDGEVGAVAERLVPGLAAAAQGHRVRVRDLPAVDIGQAYRPRYQVGAVLAGGDRDVRHVGDPFSEDPDGLGDGKLADPGTSEGGDGAGQGGCGGGDADLADPGRRLVRLDKQHVDLGH